MKSHTTYDRILTSLGCSSSPATSSLTLASWLQKPGWIVEVKGTNFRDSMVNGGVRGGTGQWTVLLYLFHYFIAVLNVALKQNSLG